MNRAATIQQIGELLKDHPDREYILKYLDEINAHEITLAVLFTVLSQTKEQYPDQMEYINRLYVQGFIAGTDSTLKALEHLDPAEFGPLRS